MDTTTSGLEIKTKRRWLADTVELVSSMRFAISLLAIIAIASVIGTVMKQGEPMPNYVNQFGPFWFEIFRKMGLYAVYTTWWFLSIMAVLVLSTSLCIARNGPKMFKDARSWRENVREQSLRNFHHKAEWEAAAPISVLASQLAERIAAAGYKVKLVAKDGATLISAKQGAASKFGYIFAHSAIVIICLGGLLDSDLPIRFQEWALGKTPFAGNGIIAQIPAQHRLGLGNPSFRGNTFIPEGSASSTAIIQRANGVLVQDLPFTIRLQKFVVDFYSTGMPKLFASYVTVTDHDTGKHFDAVIKVNQPLIYQGVAVYQSSFEDGGSKLKLTAYPLGDSRQAPFPLAGEVGGSTPLEKIPGAYTVEWSDFRAFNVENMARNGQDVRAVDIGKSLDQRFSDSLGKQLGAAAKADRAKDFKNLGPSVQYKLRDKTGQAREYQNYMLPIAVDGDSVYLAGMRDSPDDAFRYIRIPADDNQGIDEWMRLRAALMDPELRTQAAQRSAQRILPETNPSTEKLRKELQDSISLGLSLFAGQGQEAGYAAVLRFLEKKNMPAAQKTNEIGIFLKLLNGSLWELWQVARQKDGLPPVEPSDKNARFLQLAVDAYADTVISGAPVYLQLKDFTQVKASVLQVTRSPGKKVVYLGCLLLVLGVFAMLYIRERRVWVWLKPNGQGGTHALMAMSAQRKTLDFENEFTQLKARLSDNGAS